MTREKIFRWLLVGVLVNFVGAGNGLNIMKIFQEESYKAHPKSLLKFNADKAQNNTDEDYLGNDLQTVVEAAAKLNGSKCGQDTMAAMEAMTRREQWAIRMFDAASKFPVGLFYGNGYQLGNFDECINLKQPPGHKEKLIKGQYCLVDVELSKHHGRETGSLKSRQIFDSRMFWSICLPSSCTIEEVKTVTKEIFDLVLEEKMVKIELTEDKCHVKKSEPLTSLELIYGSSLGVFGVFTILATLFHYKVLQRKSNGDSKNSTAKDVVLCFSIIRNTGKFLTTKSSNLNLNCISGIKTLSMCFIICGHTFLFMVGGPVQNTNFYEQESRSFINAIFVNSPLLVDTFLLIGGFLLCYMLLIELEKRRGRVNFLILYIARYIRLTPAYLVVLGFYCSFMFRTGDGPLWNSRMTLEKERCQKSFWTNLLYINNYVNTDHLCMFQSWYLAVDYHLFIIAPIVIYPLWKRVKIGKTFLAISIIVGIFLPFIITLKDKLDPTLMVFAPEVYDISENYYFKNSYIKTHMRAGSYFLGLLFGYILYKLQIKGSKMSKHVIAFGWLMSALCGIISMFSVTIFYNPQHQYNSFEAAVYASLHRVAWCVSIGWIMIACITKNASLVNNFLSWKPFIPLSRLTYCAYLVNGFIEVYSFATIREGRYMSKFEMATKSVSHTVITFFFAFLLCILFESPIHGLEKILLKRDAAKSYNNNNNSETVNNTTI